MLFCPRCASPKIRLNSSLDVWLTPKTYYCEECGKKNKDKNEKSKYNENTIIIIWGDHGWHLGEKLRFRKLTLWSESTRMPLIIKTPRMNNSEVCNRVVNLIDLFLTLIDLCGLPERDIIDGRSFAPLLNNPDKKWPYPSITTEAENSFTVNNENWRYKNCQSSQKSGEIRHKLACCRKWSSCSIGAAPGDRLRTIGRPQAVMA